MRGCVTGPIFLFFFSDPESSGLFNVFRDSVSFSALLTADVTKVWFSDGLQPNQQWFETKTSLVEVRAYSSSSQSGRSSSSYGARRAGTVGSLGRDQHCSG